MSSENKEPFKFRNAPLTTVSDHSWSNDMKRFLKGKGLWKCFERILTQDKSNRRSADVVFCEEDKKTRDLALAYTLTSADSSWKEIVCGMRCSRRAWNTLKETFQLVSEAYIDATMLQLKAVWLKERGDHSWVLKQNPGVDIATGKSGRAVSEVWQMRALSRGLSKDYDVVVDSVMNFKQTHSEVVSRLIVRETWLYNYEDAHALALVSTAARSRSPKLLKLWETKILRSRLHKRNKKRKEKWDEEPEEVLQVYRSRTYCKEPPDERQKEWKLKWSRRYRCGNGLSNGFDNKEKQIEVERVNAWPLLLEAHVQ